MSTFSLREINPDSNDEIRWVAQGMRQTLIEVLGPENGSALYTMEWLLDRVKWHLDPKATMAKIFLAEDENGEILGHAIARLERDEVSMVHGYFSTLFVHPEARRRGLAHALINHVEAWFRSCKINRIAYNTAENHIVLIRLFEAHGFKIALHDHEMVQLVKEL